MTPTTSLVSLAGSQLGDARLIYALLNDDDEQ
jgi:hypothetical protein